MYSNTISIRIGSIGGNKNHYTDIDFFLLLLFFFFLINLVITRDAFAPSTHDPTDDRGDGYIIW